MVLSDEFRRKVAGSKAAPLAAFPMRLRQVARHDMAVARDSSRWLFASRETTNYTYDLTPRNLEHLAWWVSAVTSISVTQSRSYLNEITGDTDLQDHVLNETRQSDRRGLAESTVRLARRIGWYAVIRALQPQNVVETGTDKGLGTVVIAAALLRNGNGHLTTVDINPASGYLLTGAYAAVTTRVIMDSHKFLPTITDPIDLFIHDSSHTAEHERGEFSIVSDKLSANAVVLSDNSHATNELAAWAEKTDRRFLFFDERPAQHWYPGAGIGAAW